MFASILKRTGCNLNQSTMVIVSDIKIVNSRKRRTSNVAVFVRYYIRQHYFKIYHLRKTFKKIRRENGVLFQENLLKSQKNSIELDRIDALISLA